MSQLGKLRKICPFGFLLNQREKETLKTKNAHTKHTKTTRITDIPSCQRPTALCTMVVKKSIRLRSVKPKRPTHPFLRVGRPVGVQVLQRFQLCLSAFFRVSSVRSCNYPWAYLLRANVAWMIYPGLVRLVWLYNRPSCACIYIYYIYIYNMYNIYIVCTIGYELL